MTCRYQAIVGVYDLATAGCTAASGKVVSASRTAGGIAVKFDKTVISYGGAPVGVELCAETQESCRYAEARAGGSTLVVRDDGRPATRIRYAWADFPIANLYGPEKLEIPPFEVEVR